MLYTYLPVFVGNGENSRALVGLFLWFLERKNGDIYCVDASDVFFKHNDQRIHLEASSDELTFSNYIK
jgi:hypothetical protein